MALNTYLSTLAVTSPVDDIDPDASFISDRVDSMNISDTEPTKESDSEAWDEPDMGTLLPRPAHISSYVARASQDSIELSRTLPNYWANQRGYSYEF